MEMPVVVPEDYIAVGNPDTEYVSYMPFHSTVTKYISGKIVDFEIGKDSITVTEKEDELDVAALSELIQNVAGNDMMKMLQNTLNEFGAEAYRNAYHDVFANYRLALRQKNNMTENDFDEVKFLATDAMHNLGARGHSTPVLYIDVLQSSYGQNSRLASEKLKISRMKNADPDFFNKLETELKKENPNFLKDLNTIFNASKEINKICVPYISDAFKTMVCENSYNLSEAERMVKNLGKQQSKVEKKVFKVLKKENLPLELESISLLTDKKMVSGISQDISNIEIDALIAARKLKEVSVQVHADLEKAGLSSYSVPLMQQQVKLTSLIGSMLNGHMAEGKLTGTIISESMKHCVPEYMKDNSNFVKIGTAKVPFKQVRSPIYKLIADVDFTNDDEDKRAVETELENSLRFLHAKYDKKNKMIEAEGNRIEIGVVKRLTDKLNDYVTNVEVIPVQRVNESELMAHYNKYRGNIKKQILHEITHHPDTEYNILCIVENMVGFENTADNMRYDKGKESCFMEVGKELLKELEEEKKVMKVTTRDGTEILAKAVKKIVIENNNGKNKALGQNGRL